MPFEITTPTSPHRLVLASRVMFPSVSELFVDTKLGQQKKPDLAILFYNTLGTILLILHPRPLSDARAMPKIASNPVST